jgi:hypothetical protein
MIDFFALILSVLIFVLAVYGGQQFYEKFRKQRRPTYASEPQTPEEIEEFWRAFAENESTAFDDNEWGNHTDHEWGNHTDHDDAVPEDAVKPRKRTIKKTTTKKPRSAKE